MPEINIAGVIAVKRKESGITQNELAGYMGVSKASFVENPAFSSLHDEPKYKSIVDKLKSYLGGN